MQGPNFILGVGAQKAGTSWLYRYLETHPQCSMGPFKEMCFFCDPAMTKYTENPVQNRRKKLKQAWSISQRKNLGPRGKERLVGLLDSLTARYQPERYAELYQRIVEKNPGTRLIGDITPDYTILHPKDVRGMRDHLANMGYPVKVVLLMRDPVQRCFSAARMRDSEDAAQADGDGDGDLGGLRDLAGKNFVSFATSLSSETRTRYERTIAALEESFAPEQIFYGIYEDFFRRSEIKRLCSFLEIDFVAPKLNVRANASSGTKTLDVRKAAKVRAFYADTYAFCRDRFGRDRIDALWGPEGPR